MYGYSFGAAKSNVWHYWDPEAMLYPGYEPTGREEASAVLKQFCLINWLSSTATTGLAWRGDCGIVNRRSIDDTAMSCEVGWLQARGHASANGRRVPAAAAAAVAEVAEMRLVSSSSSRSIQLAAIPIIAIRVMP